MARKARSRTRMYHCLLINLHVEAPSGFTTDASLYLRYYETPEDEQDAEKEVEEEEEDFYWVKFTKESKERRAKEAQSSQQKKV